MPPRRSTYYTAHRAIAVIVCRYECICRMDVFSRALRPAAFSDGRDRGGLHLATFDARNRWTRMLAMPAQDRQLVAKGPLGRCSDQLASTALRGGLFAARAQQDRVGPQSVGHERRQLRSMPPALVAVARALAVILRRMRGRSRPSTQASPDPRRQTLKALWLIRTDCSPPLKDFESAQKQRSHDHRVIITGHAVVAARSAGP